MGITNVADFDFMDKPTSEVRCLFCWLHTYLYLFVFVYVKFWQLQ